MQFPKVVDEWHNEDRDELKADDGLLAWATIAIAAILVFWCLAEVLTS